METSLSTIYMLQTQTAVERFDEALYELESEVQAEIQRQAKAAQLAQSKAECNQHCNHLQPSYINTCCESGTACDSRSATENRWSKSMSPAFTAKPPAVSIWKQKNQWISL